jgi:hypothetical protein
MNTKTRNIFIILVCLPVIFAISRSRGLAGASQGDAVLVVKNTNDGGRGSLRQAILDSNASAGVLNTIIFNIPGGGLKTIYLGTSGLGPLPEITDSVIIDGYSQYGAAPANATSPAALRIELRGNNQPFGAILTVSAGNTTIKGLIINGYESGATGIQLSGRSNNFIQGNYIGLNASGTASQANGFYALEIMNVPNNLIGGTTNEARNVISGSVHISYTGATRNKIQGNYIGVDARGMYGLTNGVNKGGGVSIYFAPDNEIGGTIRGAGNLIAGSDFFGIAIEGDTATGNQIQGNMIGTNRSKARLGNSYFGVRVTVAPNNRIGGTEAGAGNTIAFASGRGVYITDRTGNAILSNSIFENGDLGIDLGGDGVSLNDSGDIDVGANNLQNFPVITRAISGSSSVNVTLDSAIKSQFHIELFANSSCDSSGFGEGELLIGSANVETRGNGSINVVVSLSQPLIVGQFITATATDSSGNTSEFSQCFAVRQ